MGSDGLIELDESCWSALAKYNLVLATVFALLLLVVRQVEPGQAQLLLVVENGVLALVFGGIQTYCWISR
ncbi:hypothetical protein M0R88_05375 [Halorussus gelatinilyticus]|uniref:Uncharacterized protein n=1 Tax=Halorussus gelatinilyticus TaxID=2937524 RepID=A0A8U0ILL1_9EURY|nr:hypothetical protein [Halorussus gelatinilyticus]UPW01535.1 hypothetical protein M0R88_05375 [Halorussus gelatinilyticus]